MTGKDRAKEAGTEYVHHCYGISRLFVVVNLANPGGEGQDTVTGNGKNESGGSYDRDASALDTGTGVLITGRSKGHGNGFTKIRPRTAIIVMKILGPLPNAMA